MAAAEPLTLTIFGREYRIACAAEERADLIACARYVDARMNEIRDQGKVMGADRVAVMTALQIAQELFAVKAGGGTSLGEIRQKVRGLNDLADQMLATQEKLF
jgi:cell division protein ZapA